MKKHVVYGFLSVVVAASVLAFLFSEVSPGDVIRLLKEADPFATTMFLVVSLTGVCLRAMRYQLFLAVSGYYVPSHLMVLVVLVRNLCVDLLPARIGSLAYVAVVTSRLRVPFSAALASWAHEIVFDLVALVPLLTAALALLYIESNATSISGWVFAVTAVIMCVVFCLAIVTLPLILGCITDWSVKLKVWLRHVLRGRAAAKYEDGLASGFDRLAELAQAWRREVLKCRGAGVYGKLVILSVLIRVCKYSSLYLFLYALLKPLGYTLATLPLGTSFLGMFSAEIAVALPFSGIAGVGLSQGVWVAVFTTLGLPLDIAKLTSISHHLFTQAYAYSLGAVAAVLLLVLKGKALQDTSGNSFVDSSVGDNSAVQTTNAQTLINLTTSSRGFYMRLAKLLFVFTAIGFVSGHLAIAQSAPSPQAAQYREAANSASARLLPEVSQVLAAEKIDLVFDSNRSGSFGIYRASSVDSRITPIVDTPRHEMFPDPSPDGKSIVYSETMSLQRNAPSRIFRLSFGGEAELISDNGTFPTYGGSGKTIYFERERNSVWRYNIEERTSEQVFPTKALPFKGELAKSRLSKDERYLFITSSEPHRWSIWRIDLVQQKKEFMAYGCEAFSGGDNGEMLWIRNNQVRDEAGIYKLSSVGGEQMEVLDRGVPRGREYFPSLALDGRLLLWGASSPGQHSHESADYQIFMRFQQTGKISGKISDKIWQVTKDTYTNRWPKALPLLVSRARD